MLLVPLKVWCRRRAGGWANVGLDDYMSVFALAVANGFFYVCIVGMRKSLGLHVDAVTDARQIVDFLRDVYVAQVLYVVAIVAIKYSILAF
ncbi:hypothetical protein N0V87_009532 [Didymella glomerata]|uniref:Rhodopsin domain-containing protein n=1 Tax=Didymella glomerata TaxID=749621 RepID=A0A9W8WQZ9_9PLEO|nr:hypothetical protein N0V87_009532 [Didymella glomerata]